MKKPLAVLLVAGILLSACGGWSTSRVNPVNWFGNSRSVPVDGAAEATEVNPLLPRGKSGGLLARPAPEDFSLPIARVTELRIEPTNSGAIIYAVGVASRQGPFESELRNVTTDEEYEQGTLSLSFRVVYPRAATPVGSEFSRTVHDAYSIGRQDLRNIRLVRVIGRENALESRRR